MNVMNYKELKNVYAVNYNTMLKACDQLKYNSFLDNYIVHDF